ncbi:putative extracellular elastinolytic metallo proteinase precursor [Lactarius pseudohatsudake]|nr:putative extracellular elastinolytic metallo proteinase precursor [Lactarius pseudohatsudake]
MTDPHIMGQVWANVLHCVYVALDFAAGWTSLALSDPTQVTGNAIFFHLLFDALLLQPCNPTCEPFSLPPYLFVFSRVDTNTERTVIQSRDAWIQADKNRYSGTHVCLMWSEFASKGLGVNAANYTDDTSMPAECG